MGYRLSQKMLQDIGENIRKARKKDRKDQLDVAIDAGVEPSYYAKIERGEAKNPSLAKLYAILRALGIRSSQILPF